MSDYGNFTTMLVEPLGPLGPLGPSGWLGPTGVGVRGLRHHLARLRGDSQALFGAACRDEEVLAALVGGLEPAGLPVVARVTVSAVDFDLAHPGGRALRPMVTTRPAPTGTPSPLRLATVGHQRALAGVKHTGNTVELLLRRRAQLAGLDDALFTTTTGSVAEGPTWAFCGLRDGALILPTADRLPSVTVTLLARAAHTLGWPVLTEDVRVGSLAGLDACFAANAVVPVRPIASIDSTTYSDSQMLTSLRRAYRRVRPTPLPPLPPLPPRR